MESEKKRLYAKVARETTERAGANKRLKEAEKLAQAKAAYASEYEKEKTRLKNGGMQQLFEEEWMPLIDGAAGRGEDETILVLQRNSGRDVAFSAENKARYDVGIGFLSQEGFSVYWYQRFVEGTGGDDPYTNETFIGIKVRW